MPKDAATLTIRNADKMKAKDRRAIAEWLRQHAEDIVKDGKQYVSTFHGRYAAPQ